MAVLRWERKLTKIRYSRYVALPPDWVREYQIDFVEILLEEDGSLRLRPLEKLGVFELSKNLETKEGETSNDN